MTSLLHVTVLEVERECTHNSMMHIKIKALITKRNKWKQKEEIFNYLRALCIHQRQFLLMVSSEPFNSRAMLLPLEAFTALSFMFRWIDPCVGFVKTGRNYVDHCMCAVKKENSLCLYFWSIPRHFMHSICYYWRSINNDNKITSPIHQYQAPRSNKLLS